MCKCKTQGSTKKKSSKVPLELRVSAPICLNGTTVHLNSVQKKNLLLNLTSQIYSIIALSSVYEILLFQNYNPWVAGGCIKKVFPVRVKGI